METQPHTAIDINNVDIEVEFHRTLTEEEQMKEIERIKKEREGPERQESEESKDQGRRLDEGSEGVAEDTVLCKNWYQRPKYTHQIWRGLILCGPPQPAKSAERCSRHTLSILRSTFPLLLLSECIHAMSHRRFTTAQQCVLHEVRPGGQGFGEGKA